MSPTQNTTPCSGGGVKLGRGHVPGFDISTTLDERCGGERRQNTTLRRTILCVAGGSTAVLREQMTVHNGPGHLLLFCNAVVVGIMADEDVL